MNRTERYDGTRSNLDATTLRLVRTGQRVRIRVSRNDLFVDGTVTKTCGGRAWVLADGARCSEQYACSRLTVL